MKKLIILFAACSTLLLTESCCDCSNDKQELNIEKLTWIPNGEIGDSIVFQNEQGATKTYYITEKKENLAEPSCPPIFCCSCEENNVVSFSFIAREDTVSNAANNLDEIEISLTKSKNVLKKHFYFNCSSDFQDFDYLLDTFIINGKLYKNVLVKESKTCKSKVYFTKGFGYIRFEDENGTWNRIN